MPWNYYGLSQNPNITWEIVQANPEKDWSYRYLSMNPNITWEIVQANPQIPWHYGSLSMNPMTKAKEEFIQKELIKEFSERCALTKIKKYANQPGKFLWKRDKTLFSNEFLY